MPFTGTIARLFAKARVVALWLDADGRVVECSSAFRELTGFGREDLEGLEPANMLCSLEDSAPLGEGLRAIRTHQGGWISVQWARPVPIELDSARFVVFGLPVGDAGAAAPTDAARSQALEAEVVRLRAELEARHNVTAPDAAANPWVSTTTSVMRTGRYFRALIENATDGIAIVSPDGEVRYMSPAVERILGYDPMELTGTSLWDYVHEEDRPRAQESFQHSLSNPGDLRTVTARFRHEGGAYRVLAYTGSAMVDDPLIRGMVFNFHDITERIEAEEHTRRLLDAVSAANDGIAIADADGRYIYVNHAFAEICGHAEQSILGRTWAELAGTTVPAAPSSVFACLQDHTAASAAATVPFLKPSGEPVLIDVSVRALNDAHGAFLGHICTARDVTDRVRTQDQLQRHAQILEQVHEAVVATDPDGRIILWNPGAERLFAAPGSLALGADIRTFIAETELELPRYWSSPRLIEAGVHEVEAQMRTSVGRSFWALLSLSTMRHSNGAAAGVVATVLDITARRTAEQAITRRLQVERTLADISGRFVGRVDVEQAINAALTTLGRLSGASRAGVYLVRDAHTASCAFAWQAAPQSTGDVDHACFDVSEMHWLMTGLSRLGHVAVHDVEELPEHADTLRTWLRAHGARSALFVPLFVGGAIGGVVALEDVGTSETWHDDEMILLRVTAEVLGHAIERRRAEHAEQKAHAQASILHKALAALTSELDLEPVLDQLLDYLAQVVDYDSAVVLMAEGEVLRAVTCRGALPSAVQTLTLSTEDPLFEHIMAAPGPFRWGGADASCPRTALPWASQTTARTWLGVPLLSRGGSLGCLILASQRTDAFDAEQAELVLSFAAEASIAIDNARLFDAVQRAAQTDPLTGLPNRRHLLELAEHEVQRSQRYGTPLAAILMDVDYFKRVNDSWGHAMGDAALVEVALRCRAQLRASDHIGRYGGEEFVAVLPESDHERAFRVAERLRSALSARPVVLHGVTVGLTLSLGVAAFDDRCGNLDELLRRADQAMYQAKQAGRDAVRGYGTSDLVRGPRATGEPA